jgi:hypothetical protein
MLRGAAKNEAPRLASRISFREDPAATNPARASTGAMMNGAAHIIVAKKCAGSGGNAAVSQERADRGSVEMNTHTPAIDSAYRTGERDLAHTMASALEISTETAPVTKQ